MAINPLELKPSGAVPTEERRRSPPANKAGRSFADVLTSSLDAKTETSTTTTNKATAAAELFRLEMMKAALSLDAPLSDPSFRSSQEAIIALITRLANSEDKHIPAPLVQQPIVAPPPLQAAPEIEDTISEPETALLQEMLSTRQAPPEKANAIPFALSLDTIISKAALRYGEFVA